jgi:hypothetical protein
MPTHPWIPIPPTFESLGEIVGNDVVDPNDLHAIPSGLRSKCFLDSRNFDGASGSEDRCNPSSARKPETRRSEEGSPPDPIAFFEKLVYNMGSQESGDTGDL